MNDRSQDLFERLINTYIDHCYFHSEIMDNYLNPFFSIEEERFFRAGILELIRLGQHVEAKIMLRLIESDISLKELFRAIEHGLEKPPSEEEFEAFLNERKSHYPPKIKIPF